MNWSALNKFNPEINYKGKHVKISLITIGAVLFGISQTPVAMTLLGASAATAAAVPGAVQAVMSIAAPIFVALNYNPKDGAATPTSDMPAATAPVVAGAAPVTPTAVIAPTAGAAKP